MSTIRNSCTCVLLFASFVLTGLPAIAQSWITDIWTGTNPQLIAVNPATNRIYVVNYDDEQVAVIDGGTNTLLTTVDVGRVPSAIAVNPITNRIYVVNNRGDSVTVIRGENNTAYTLPAPHYPYAVAINTTTNKIYVTGDSWDGKLMRIDGASNLTNTIDVRWGPEALGINPFTNKIYVANTGDPNTVSVIDGATFTNVKTVLVGRHPEIVAVNPATNFIYTLNGSDDSISVINGATDTTVATITLDGPRVMALNPVTNILYVGHDNGTVTLIRGTQVIGEVATGKWASGIVVNPVTNKIYITNAYNDTLTMVDGETNLFTTVHVGNGPEAVTANLSINRVYTVNPSDNTISVVAGAGTAGLQFVSMTPCRLVDTRNGNGGVLQGGTSRSFTLPDLGGCGLPSTADAYSLNVTVVPQEPLGYLTIWPTGQEQPLASTMNSLDGRFKANAAIVPAGYSGAVSVYASNKTHVVLDINGYFTTPSAQTYQFYPLTPCRVIDTRWRPDSDLGGPALVGGGQRDFPVTESSCIPQVPNIAAYSLNFTAVPNPTGQQLGYLTAWPQGQAKPVVSTLNNPTATVVANAAIVPAGTSGGISVFVDQGTHLAVDINGYFAPAGSGGLSLYPTAPCRALDTRKTGNGQPFTDTIVIDIVGSTCAPPSVAKAFTFNATVVPSPQLSYLTLWPNGQNKPTVSTLNALDGRVTSNMAIVPSTDGKIKAYAAGTTHLILDLSAYYAPEQSEE